MKKISLRKIRWLCRGQKNAKHIEQIDEINHRFYDSYAPTLRGRIICIDGKWKFETREEAMSKLNEFVENTSKRKAR